MGRRRVGLGDKKNGIVIVKLVSESEWVLQL